MATTTRERPPVTVLPELCKGCGRCIEACPKHAIQLGTEINQASGLIPIVIDYEICNFCGLCLTACPEPWGLIQGEYDLEHPELLYGPRKSERQHAETIPDRAIPLPKCEPLILKGNYAAAVGAILGGCRHVFGYPITPSTEGAELMAKLQPKLHGVFMQAVSEVATINHMYGCGGAGMRTMTFTSSPGFSLMLEGISYLIGAELPAVIINVMRPGPGLGFIGPEQSDIKLACRGLGHGNTHAIVLSPTSPQEMLDLTMAAFDLAFKYRNPVIVAADGYLGQITGRVNLPDHMVEPGLPDWAVYGDAAHRDNVNSSILQDWQELEKHNEKISAKYERIIAAEQRANHYQTEDAKVLVVACNTPARTSKSAVERLRQQGIAAGLFQPVTVWPFPIDHLLPLMDHVEQIVVVEASWGQLEDEMRLAMHKAGFLRDVPIHHVRHMGGILPEEQEVVAKIQEITEA